VFRLLRLHESARLTPSAGVLGFGDLNGAEKEALLDLLEKRPQIEKASHSL
jgi:hypothetical protein